MEPRSSQERRAREAILANAITYANNALWNYVSILSWLRTLRAAKVAMIIVPAIFGGLASWYALNGENSPNMVAGFAALAGFFPVLYVALGLDQSISYFRVLAGRYRLIHALFQDLSATSARYSDEQLIHEYDRVFADYCRLREEAHTVPHRYFVSARKAIEQGEYSLLGTGATVEQSDRVQDQ